MGKQRSRQLQDGRGFIKDGSVVGDRHTQRKQRGEEMIRTLWHIPLIFTVVTNIFQLNQSFLISKR